MGTFTANELRILLKAKWNELNTMNLESIGRYRQCHLQRFDGDVTPNLSTWPRHIRRLLFKQTAIGDRETFTFFLFFIVNVYST